MTVFNGFPVDFLLVLVWGSFISYISNNTPNSRQPLSPLLPGALLAPSCLFERYSAAGLQGPFLARKTSASWVPKRKPSGSQLRAWKFPNGSVTGRIIRESWEIFHCHVWLAETISHSHSWVHLIGTSKSGPEFPLIETSAKDWNSQWVQDRIDFRGQETAALLRSPTPGRNGASPQLQRDKTGTISWMMVLGELQMLPGLVNKQFAIEAMAQSKCRGFTHW